MTSERDWALRAVKQLEAAADTYALEAWTTDADDCWELAEEGRRQWGFEPSEERPWWREPRPSNPVLDALVAMRPLINSATGTFEIARLPRLTRDVDGPQS